MTEQWKKIPGYEGYMASTHGFIKSLDRNVIDGRTGEKTKKVKGRLLKPSLRGCYLNVNLHGKNKSVHRLVAMTFIDDFYKYPEVNHIDGVKTNNNIQNLEMVTRQENAIHMYKTGLMIGPHTGKKGKLNHLSMRVQGIKDGIVIHNFDCMRDADSVGFVSSCISRASNGLQKKHKGFEWRIVT